MPIQFQETLHRGYQQTVDVVGEMLVDERTAFQHLQIFDTPLNGRMMVLDGIVQITDRDEAPYSEMLVHVPAVELGDPRRAFIVGGGDGAVAEECLKHPDLRVEMCEIDGRVVEACREHFAHVNKGCFDDPRFTLHLADAFEFLKQPDNRGRFDVVIADRPDPVGPAAVLFATEFYELVRDSLTDRGVAIFQNGAPFYQPEELTETVAQLRGVFPKLGLYLTVVPTYTGGYMALTWASKRTELGRMGEAELAARIDALGLVTDHYAADVHRAAFAVPPWIRKLAG